MNDKVEYDRGTNPGDGDTDNDALDDRQEIYYYGTYGYTWDSDEDELSDNDERILLHLNKLECLAITSEYFVVYYPDGRIEKVTGSIKGTIIPPMSRHLKPK